MRRARAVTWDEVRVGLFLLAALTILAFGTFLVGRMGHVFGERYQLVTLLGSAAGLTSGAIVQVAGQTAGQVERIELIPPERRLPSGEAVEVWLAIDREAQSQIRADSRVRVRTQGLLGDRLLDIEPGTPGARVLTEGDTVPAAPSVSFNELFDEAATAVVRLRELTTDLTAMTERLLEGEGSLGRLMRDDALYDRLVDLTGSLDALLSGVADGTGSLGRLAQDDELYERLSSAAAALDSLTARVAAGEGTLGRLVESDSLYRALVRAALRSDSLLLAVQGGEGTLGRLFVDEGAYEELLQTLVELNAILDDLRQNPRRYIPPVEVF